MKKIILAIILMSLLNLGCRFTIFGAEITLFEPTPTIPPQNTLTGEPDIEFIQTATISAQPTPLRWKVCFSGSVTEGYLRVRECPGMECNEIGLLAAGDLVLSDGETQEMTDGTWLLISHPLNGWVNQRFVCQEK